MRRRDELESTLPNASSRDASSSASPAGPEEANASGGASAGDERSASGTFGGQDPAARITHAMARSASHALRGEEASRVRGFAAATLVICVFAMLAEPFVVGVWWLRALTMGTIAFVGGVSARTFWLARDPSLYTRRVARTFAAAVLAGSTVFTYRVGVFSPAPILATLSVAFFAFGEDRLLAYVYSAATAAAYALTAMLVSTGAIADAGAMQAMVIPASSRNVAVVVVLLAFALVLASMRHARRSMLDAIGRSNDWFREARRREAKRGEADRDLDQLLKMSAGEIAPYNGTRAGKYMLDARIGRGAMGEVYAAKDAVTGQPAAVKLLHPSMQEDALYMQRFLREGEAASKLRAPNVVSIFEVGKLEDGAPYIAMELLRGHDLGWHLRRRTSLAIDEVVYLVEQVAAGLETARLAGVVHRDLKPPNLFLAQQKDASPIWKILDFGVSRLTDSSGTLTKDIIVGTPGYMSPEQAGGLAATHRSDLFSFGAVVYRALTGHPPFTAVDTPQTLYQVVYRNPVRPSALVASLPPDVDLVLAIALAKDPADRFASALAMSRAFTAAAKSALDPEMRLHGRTLVAALPWGSAARDSHLDGAELEEIDAQEESHAAASDQRRR